MGLHTTRVRLADSIRVRSNASRDIFWISEVTVYRVDDGDSPWMPIRIFHKLPDGEDICPLGCHFSSADGKTLYERLKTLT